MRKCAFFWVALVILSFQVWPLSGAQAEVVGRLTQVEGRVDILKGGKLPATPVKVNDGVQTSDVLRTKSQSKAQITFIDNSTLTISPESRVAIESYMYNAAQNKRNAVVQLFQGLAHVVVSKIMKTEEPDFVVKTQTAIMGVRGTDFGVRLHPNSSDVLNFTGLLQVGNRLPEVSQLFRRAFAVAYSFGERPGQHWVLLKAMQGTTVGRGLPPSAVFPVSRDMMNNFLQQFSSLSGKGQGGVAGAAGSAITAGTGGAAVDPGALPAELGTTGAKVIGVEQPGTTGVIPVNPTLPTSPVSVVTPPKVLPSTTPPPPPAPPPPPPTPPLPPHPPR